jgi:hypothetical protein
MQEYLLDPFLFDNQSNLVNASNPWGKYISSNPDDKEMLASYWYSKTWDENITNPTRKTGKSAGLTSYCGKPCLLSALHLSKSVQEQSREWLVQAYLPTWRLAPLQRRRSTLTATRHMAGPTTTTTK